MGYKQQLVTSNQKLVSTSNKLTSLEVKARALLIAGELASTIAPNDMTAWYCKAYKALGEGRYTGCAKAAQKENSPRLFGWLLKQELNKIN